MPDYNPEAYQFIGNDYGALTARQKQLQEKRDRLIRQASDAARMTSPGGQMVGGWYVPPSVFQMLEKPAAQVMNAYQQRALDKDQAAYDADEKSAASAVMARIPAPRTEQVRMANPPGEEPGYLESTKTTQPTREDKMKWAQEGMQVPSLRQTLSKYYDDQLINEPIRQEARDEKRADREDRQADTQLRQKLELEYKRETLKQQAEAARQRSEDTRLSIQQRADAAREHNELMAELGRGRLAVDQQKANNAGAKMTDKARSDLDAYNASAQGLDIAIAALDKASDKGTGYLAGLVTDKVPGGQKIMSGRRDAATNDAIQQLTYWTDAIRHDRFGATFTGGEKAAASKYLPDEYDSLDDLKRKATGLKSLLDLNHQRLRAQYGDFVGGGASGNYGPPTGSAGGVPAQGVPSGVTVRRVR